MDRQGIMSDHVLIDARTRFEAACQTFLDTLEEGGFAYLDRVAFCDNPYKDGPRRAAWAQGYNLMIAAVRQVAQ